MIEFLKEMTIGNQFLLHHCLGGMLLGRIFYTISWSYNKERFAILAVLLVAILWEIFELYLFGTLMYSGGLIGYIADAVGDVGGAVIFAWVVLNGRN